MITIETPKIEETNSKQATVQAENKLMPENELKTISENMKQMQEKNTALETSLKTANEKISQQEKLLTETNEKNKLNPEQLIKDAINSQGRIHKYVLGYILRKEEFETTLNVGSLNFRRVYLGDGWYQLLR
jgi:predicted nuclease with TOPRIM domain